MATVNYSVYKTSDVTNIRLQFIAPEYEYDDRGKFVNWYIAIDKNSFPSEHIPDTYNYNAQIRMDPGDTQSSVIFEGFNCNSNIRFLCVVETAGFTTLFYGKGEVPYVSPWDWYKDEETEAALDAVSGNGETSDFLYSFWNDMVYKVYYILEALGYRWQTYYAKTDDTIMKPSDKELTAVRFNSLIYNIDYRCSYQTGIDPVSPGDIVYGSYFLTIAECINNWIEHNPTINAL